MPSSRRKETEESSVGKDAESREWHERGGDFKTHGKGEGKEGPRQKSCRRVTRIYDAFWSERENAKKAVQAGRFRFGEEVRREGSAPGNEIPPA